MFNSYPVNLLFVQRCPVMSVSSGLKFEHVKKFPLDKTDRDARLMYCRYVTSIRGDEFCHRITKFCMFCLFSLRNKAVCQSDQAIKKPFKMMNDHGLTNCIVKHLYYLYTNTENAIHCYSPLYQS